MVTLLKADVLMQARLERACEDVEIPSYTSDHALAQTGDLLITHCELITD